MSTDQTFSVRFTHRLRFVRDAFEPADATLAELIAAGGNRPASVLVFLDRGVAEAWPKLSAQIEKYADVHHQDMALADRVQIIPGGEACKNDRGFFYDVCERMHQAGLCRQSFVLAVGGGAVLDMVGFAAAVVHRGVRLVRVPTTTLAQADSGVGVKNSINGFGKKNYFGTFVPPWAVVNDEHLLATLSDDDWRCGFAEAVKVGLIKDAGLFADVSRDADRLRERDEALGVSIIRRSALLHLKHITDGGDPFELTEARPLDFGHWSAHKLEQMTGFRLRHGQAVAIGIALDATYASVVGMLPPEQASTILGCLTRLGLPTFDPAMRETQVLFEGLEEFREHLGGRLTLTQLAGIGRAVEVHGVDQRAMREAVTRLDARRSEPAPSKVD